MNSTSSNNRGSLIAGSVLVALGLLLLAGQFMHVSLWRFMAPFLVIAPGVALLAGAVIGGRQVRGLVVPGSIITTIGLILLFQTITSNWISWAYAWALVFPGSLGLGILLLSHWSGDLHARQVGARMLTIGLALFVLLGVLHAFGQWSLAWPLALIALGVYLLLDRRPRTPLPPPPPSVDLR